MLKSISSSCKSLSKITTPFITKIFCTPAIFIIFLLCQLDLPQVDCERASENEGRSLETRAKVDRRVDLFRLRNIEFNLHIVGAKKPQEQSTGCTGLNYSKSTS